MREPTDPNQKPAIRLSDNTETRNAIITLFLRAINDFGAPDENGLKKPLTDFMAPSESTAEESLTHYTHCNFLNTKVNVYEITELVAWHILFMAFVQKQASKLSSYSIHALLTTSLYVANNVVNDRYLSIYDTARISGLRRKELRDLKADFIKALDWKLCISRKDYNETCQETIKISHSQFFNNLASLSPPTQANEARSAVTIDTSDEEDLNNARIIITT